MESGNSIEIPDAFERLKLFKSSNKSSVWKHFGFVERGGNLVKCVHCETTLKYSGNTTNFRTHLRSRHRNIFDAMVSTEPNAPRTSEVSQNGIESTVGTIVYEILPSGLTYSPENAAAGDSEKGTEEKETTVYVETTSQECVAAGGSGSCERAATDEGEVSYREVYLTKEDRVNRKRKNTAVDLATVTKLMKDFLEYQKESDRLFLEMEREWQEREERLRKEDREHSLYMLKLLLAKKQDK